MAYQIVVSPDGARRFSYVGQRCLALNGVSAEAAMADPSLLYRLVLPEHRAALERAEAAAFAAGEPFDIEIAMYGPAGEVRWRRLAAVPRPQPDGSTLWDGLQIDVTDRHQMAAELEEQRNRLEMAVETTGLGLWEWDLRTEAVTWSARNRQLFGVAPEANVTIAAYLAAVHPDDLDRVSAAYVAARDAPQGGEFSVEHRIVTPAGEVRWILVHGRVIRDRQGPKLVLGTCLDVSRRRAEEDRRQLLMGELAHRAKNGMLVMQAMVHQAARSAASVSDFEEVLSARLQAMATSQDLVTQAGGRPVRVSDLLALVLAGFDLGRFELDPALAEVTVNQETAIGIALLSHEMGTNALKYGALSSPGGRVRIARKAAAGGHAAIEWSERGGPPVQPSGRRGFGTRLLEAALRDRGGRVQASFAPDGFTAHVEFQAAQG